MRTARSAERRQAAPPEKAEAVRLAEFPVIRIPVSACTLAGFRAWCVSDEFPQQGQIFYLDGEIYIDMSPERLNSHNKVKTEVTRVLGNIVVEDDGGEMYSDRTRIANEPARLSNEPDAVFVSWESFESGRVRLVPTADGDDVIELEGAPDWVLEILSPNSEKKDLERLPKIYHAAGIPEYWLIDARGEEIEFTIQVREADGYKPASRRGGWQKSRAFGRSFRLERKRDQIGQWEYRLRVKRG
jgi:Uma2 family endonuclease